METVAAIAAGMFAVLDPASTTSKGGSMGGAASSPVAVPSNWKQKGRSESLR